MYFKIIIPDKKKDKTIFFSFIANGKRGVIGRFQKQWLFKTMYITIFS